MQQKGKQMNKYIDAIDRGQLIRDILDEYGDTGGTEDANKIYRMILNQPTADVRENVKGEWVRWYEEIKHDGYTEYIPHCKCPKCETEYDSHTVKFINFCPNCGAQMVRNKP